MASTKTAKKSAQKPSKAKPETMPPPKRAYGSKKIMGSGSKTQSKARSRLVFSVDEYVVYPTHGVGQILDIKEHEIVGEKIKFFIINFEHERMVLKLPIKNVSSTGMRKLATKNIMNKAFLILKKPAKIKRTMWSRRAQEYEMKINSGDLNLLSEVVRDLHRSPHQPEQSYSERQLYEDAFERLIREVKTIYKINDEGASDMLLEMLNHPTRYSTPPKSKSEI